MATRISTAAAAPLPPPPRLRLTVCRQAPACQRPSLTSCTAGSGKLSTGAPPRPSSCRPQASCAALVAGPSISGQDIRIMIAAVPAREPLRHEPVCEMDQDTVLITRA